MNNILAGEITQGAGMKVYVGTDGQVIIYQGNSKLTSLPVDQAAKIVKHILKAISLITSENTRAIADIPEAVSDLTKAAKKAVETDNRFQEIIMELPDV